VPPAWHTTMKRHPEPNRSWGERSRGGSASQRELIGLEVRRVALERREEAVRQRELELEERAAELAALARKLNEIGAILAGLERRSAPE